MTTYSIGKQSLDGRCHPLELIALEINVGFRFMENMAVAEMEEALSVAVKDKHTVIDKWPYQLKLRPGQPGAQEEFDLLVGAGLAGTERYVEWRRTKMYREEMDGEAVKTLLENMMALELWR